MRIEDIAQLAGVSISTVSKIVNGKDQNINAKTRKKVLDIVKEYNYTPYSSVKNNWRSKAFLLGFLNNDTFGADSVFRGAMDAAQLHNYSVIMCNCAGNQEAELKNITKLYRHNVDGVLWDRESSNRWENEQQLDRYNIPFFRIGRTAGEGFRIDFKKLGYYAAEKLAEYGHRRIGCAIYPSQQISEDFAAGFRQCMYDRQILLDEQTAMIDAGKINGQVLLGNLTGIVCVDTVSAAALYRFAESKNQKVPEQLSIIGLCDSRQVHSQYNRVSLIRIPFYDYGRALGLALISELEKTEIAGIQGDWNIELSDESSVSYPYDYSSRSIVVVGSIHMDSLVQMRELPQIGKTVAARSCTLVPGGKGMNQAVGAARLGAKVSLIGRIGRDYDGNDICALLGQHNVNIEGISTDERDPTGKAYIYVQEDGESSIIIYAGANENLAPDDLRQNEVLFEHAGYCLVPMELPLKTVEQAMEQAQRHHVKIILKPSASTSLSQEMMEKIHIFVPNEKEAAAICPHSCGIEEQAEYFRSRGADIVIITLGAKGCYLKTDTQARFFPAADEFIALDTTGAADAFIAALAVYLEDGYPLVDAVQYATCAAGFCVSRQGAMPSMVDRTTLELYMKK